MMIMTAAMMTRMMPTMMIMVYQMQTARKITEASDAIEFITQLEMVGLIIIITAVAILVIIIIIDIAINVLIVTTATSVIVLIISPILINNTIIIIAINISSFIATCNNE